MLILTKCYSFKKRKEKEKDKKKWNDDFKGTLFFLHETANCCGVVIRSKILYSKEKKTDKNGRLLLLEVTIDEQDFVLVNLYNANTEKDQLNIINELQSVTKYLRVTLVFA